MIWGGANGIVLALDTFPLSHYRSFVPSFWPGEGEYLSCAAGEEMGLVAAKGEGIMMMMMMMMMMNYC